MSSEPALLPPGLGRTTWQLGHEFTTKASRAVTRGAYTMLEQVCAGPPPPLHIHDNEEGALYVLGEPSISSSATRWSRRGQARSA